MSVPAPSFLLPPREITKGEGHLTLAAPASSPRTLVEAEGWLRGQGPTGWTIRHDPALGAESYQLVISRQGIDLAAGDAAGLLFALQSLRQLWAEDPTAQIGRAHV